MKSGRLVKPVFADLSMDEFHALKKYADEHCMTVSEVIRVSLTEHTGIIFRERKSPNRYTKQAEEMKNANPQHKNHQVQQVSNTVLIADEIKPEVSGIIDADEIQMRNEACLGRMM